MKHMKLTDGDRENDMPTAALNDSKEAYPYGLMINLGESEIKKLGFSGIPKVGEALELSGKVKVVHASMSDHGGGKKRSVGLQITHMDLDDDKPEKKDAAAALYGKTTKSEKKVGSLNSEVHAWGSTKK